MGSRAIRAGLLAIMSLAFCGIVRAAPPPPAHPPVAFRTPREAIVALYRLPSIPITAADKQRFFAGDMAAALIKDSDRDDEVGVANDGDYRYDAQDMKITGLHIESIAVREGAATARVAFSNFRKLEAVNYLLCQRVPRDWRITDVITPSGGSLRKLLGLAPVGEAKGC
jgi:hypothetical protein